MCGARLFVAAMLLAAVTATTACTENTTRGAGIGAAAGAGLGALSGNGILSGAATGAVVGGAGGYIYDKLHH
jgi:predicted small secreted protein